jgi:hypothetical protein
LRKIAVILINISPELGSVVTNLMSVAEKAAACGGNEQDSIQRIRGMILSLITAPAATI